MYKYKILKRFCKTPKTSSIFDKRTNKFYNRIDVCTGVNPLFTKYYDKFYKNKIKYINEEVLYQLDPLGIAIWYMDVNIQIIHIVYLQIVLQKRI